MAVEDTEVAFVIEMRARTEPFGSMWDGFSDTLSVGRTTNAFQIPEDTGTNRDRSASAFGSATLTAAQGDAVAGKLTLTAGTTMGSNISPTGSGRWMQCFDEPPHRKR